jgi:hypothetical protein
LATHELEVQELEDSLLLVGNSVNWFPCDVDAGRGFGDHSMLERRELLMPQVHDLGRQDLRKHCVPPLPK